MNLSQDNRSRSNLLFYVLVAYVFLQFISWSYLLFKLNNEVYRQKSEILLYTSDNPNEVLTLGNELNSKLHKKWLMIVGEGTVFLVIMTLGIIQIAKTRQKEIELIKQQKNFLLAVTHELKSPIASVKLQLQTLQKHDLTKEKQNDIIVDAIADTERLNSLAENILLSAKIEVGSSSIRKEKTNISELLTGIAQKYNVLFKKKLEMHVEKEIYLDIDTMSFPSILLNVLENASKYSPEDSTIMVDLKKTNNTIIITVADEGEGVSDIEKPNIFKKFYRIGNEETRKTKGTGLGLYIVKNLVEQHNGRIAVRNNSPKGTVFEITFNT